MHAFAVPVLLLVGSLLALQGAANVQLSSAIGSPFGASTLQLAVGAMVLLALAAAAGALGALGGIGDAEPWTLLGGLGSAIYITAGVLLFPRLGALVAVGLFIAGQMFASLLVDGFGWLGVERDEPGAAAFAGAVAVLAGTWLIVRAQRGRQGLDGARRSGWLVVGILAGAALPIQGAVNAQLRAELDAAFAAATISFVVATAAMGVALVAVVLAGAPRPRAGELHRVPWWGWLGGLCGATYVTSVFLLIPEIGAAPVVVLTIAGQQLASVAVDQYGLFRLPRRAVTRSRVSGVAVLLAGVALIALG